MNIIQYSLVSVPYEITLLSNCTMIVSQSYQFQYLMKLHYSQTKLSKLPTNDIVSVPYEITLLSNIYT